MLISRDERNLLSRVGQHLREQIKSEEANTAPSVGARGKRNRLLRDERDLAALRRRLEAGQAPLPLQQTEGGG